MPKATKKTRGVEPSDDMDKWTVPLLKDFLRSKNARLEGNKAKLLERVKCYARQEPENPIIVAQFAKHQEELQEKRKIFEKAKNDGIQFKDIYAFDSPIPKTFNEIQVNTYLTHQLAEINGELVDFGIEKPATKGKDMYDSGVTTLVEYCMLDNEVIFSANVEASMNNVVYYPQVLINMQDGKIVISKCTCEASESGTCTHVSCLLHLILDIATQKEPKISQPCTSQSQNWGHGKKRVRDPKFIVDSVPSAMKFSEFDPRPPALRYTSQKKTNDFFDRLP